MMQEHSFISNFKFVLRLVVFLLLVSLLFQYASVKYKEAADKNVVNAFTAKRYEDFYALPPQSVDMVFIGSSHSYCTFDPENFDSYFDSFSFQMGTPLQHPDTTYYALRDIYKTQTPQVVVMELYWDVLDDDFDLKQANSFFEVLQDDALKKEYIWKVFPLGDKVKYFLLPIRFQQDYFAYEANEMEKAFIEKGLEKKRTQIQEGEEYYRSKGYVYCNMEMLPGEYEVTNQFRGLDGKAWKMSKKQESYVKEIAKLCEEKGSQLIFVTAPIANVSMDYIKNYDIIHESLKGLAQQCDVPYLDYNIMQREESMLENDHFRDDAHLNDSGVQIVNQHFRDWLRMNGIVFDKGMSGSG